jgi:hypothetical protein
MQKYTFFSKNQSNLRVKARLPRQRQLVTAAVVPNPSLSGACTWNNGNQTSAAKGGKPQGVSLASSYGRCHVGAANGTAINDGTLPITAYYNGNTALTANGLTTAGIYAGVAPKIFCSNSELPAQQVACPTLTLLAGCGVSLTALNTTVTVPANGCLDVEYTSVGAQQQTYLICTNSGGLGPQNIKCTSEMSYGSNKKTREADCNLGIGNNPGNASVSQQILTAGASSGTKAEQNGITFSVSMNRKIECIEGTIATTCQGVGTPIYYRQSQWSNNNKLWYFTNGCACGATWGDPNVEHNEICNGATTNAKIYDELDAITNSACTSGYATLTTGTSNVPSDFSCKLKTGWDDNW